MGRPKLRFPGSGGPITSSSYAHEFEQFNFTPSTSFATHQMFAGPVPTGATSIKCVMFQPELMESKDDISHLELTLAIANDAATGHAAPCSAQSTVHVDERTDDSRDTKKMVTFRSGEASLAGRCASVTVTANHVTSGGIDPIVFCYVGDDDDDEPN